MFVIYRINVKGKPGTRTTELRRRKKKKLKKVMKWSEDNKDRGQMLQIPWWCGISNIVYLMLLFMVILISVIDIDYSDHPQANSLVTIFTVFFFHTIIITITLL